MKKVKNSKLPKLVTLISMGLASVPVHGISYDSPLLASSTQQALYQPVLNKFVALPLDDATNHMNKLTELIRGDLRDFKKLWSNHGYPEIEGNTDKLGNDLYENVTLSVKDINNSLKDIKLALNSLNERESNKKVSIVAFGRSLASYRNSLEEIISFIEQTHKPKKTTKIKLDVTETDVRKLIRSEHIKLGLSKPTFDVVDIHG